MKDSGRRTAIHDSFSRREELVAAALTGDMTEDERQEYAAMVADDPTMLEDLEELRAMTVMLDGGDTVWREEQPSADLIDRIVAATEDRPVAPPAVDQNHSDVPRVKRLRRTVSSLVAAALIVVGAAGGLAVRELVSGPPQGPPGTLGVAEEVAFEDVPSGASVEGAVVAHTWGTETVLAVNGVGVGETFDVVLIDEQGRELSAGTFFGTASTVSCRMNAAVLREDVRAVQITADDGSVVTSTALPSIG